MFSYKGVIEMIRDKKAIGKRWITELDMSTLVYLVREYKEEWNNDRGGKKSIRFRSNKLGYLIGSFRSELDTQANRERENGGRNVWKVWLVGRVSEGAIRKRT